jgi:hypothetical protein
MCVVNGIEEKREGLITRERNTAVGSKKSVIDFVLVSNDLVKHIGRIHIDDQRINVLTKIRKTKDGVEYSESDHNLIETQLKLSWSPNEQKVIEVFKFKDTKALTKFKYVTSNTTDLSKIIDSNKSIHLVTKKFLKRLKGFMHQCFKKVKIVEKPDEELENLYNKRRILRTRTDEASEKELEEVENELSEKYSDKMYNKIMGELKGKTDSEEGGFNVGSLWKLNKKLSPRYNDPPTAMVNSEGTLLTTDEVVLDEAVKHYKEVFKDKNINKELEQHRKDKRRVVP